MSSPGSSSSSIRARAGRGDRIGKQKHFRCPRTRPLIYFLNFKFCNFLQTMCRCYSSTALSLAGNSGRLALVRHSSRKSSATHSYRCLQCFRVSKPWYGCQCLDFSTCVQTTMHAMACCTDTVRESALEVYLGRKIRCRTGARTRVSIAPGFSVGSSTIFFFFSHLIVPCGKTTNCQ